MINKYSWKWIQFWLVPIIGCQNTYYYSDSKTSNVEIKADTDSAAYMEAYKRYCIAIKVYGDYSKKYGSDMVSPLTGKFRLLNHKMIDITDAVKINNKKILEDSLRKKIYVSVDTNLDTSQAIRPGGLMRTDTTGLYTSPIKVTSAKFVSDEYSSYKDVRLTYKNVSTKTVAAIRFRWHGVNAFNESADLGGHVLGVGGGFTEDIIKPGGSDSGEWDISSRDGKTITLSYAYEVMFSDGTKWKLNN